MLFYKPENGFCGDLMPYFIDGEFVFFYLHTSRPSEEFSDVCWHMVKTKDFVHYYDDVSLGIRGGTGSVLKRNAEYNIFYCDNSDFDTSEDKKQYICQAVTNDFEQIVEINKFPCDEIYYDKASFRDPHVFYNNEKSEYWMLVSSRVKGPSNRSGCVGLLTSPDLKKWNIKKPLYSPHIDVGAHECPDIFKMGEFWYLIYSSYTGFYATVYRKSRSVEGPFMIPKRETFDARGFYAGKTVEHDSKRYLVGWCASKEAPYMRDWNPNYSGNDYNVFDWGGNVVVHELRQSADGALNVSLPDSVYKSFKKHENLRLKKLFNNCEINGNNLIISTNEFSAVLANDMPDTCLIECSLTMSEETRRCGIFVRGSQSLDKAYYITLNAQRNMLEFNTYLWQDEKGWRVLPSEAEQQMPYVFMAGLKYQVKIIISGSICIVYFNNEIALTSRMYDLPAGKFGFFAVGGETNFEEIRLLAQE